MSFYVFYFSGVVRLGVLLSPRTVEETVEVFKEYLVKGDSRI